MTIFRSKQMASRPRRARYWLRGLTAGVVIVCSLFVLALLKARSFDSVLPPLLSKSGNIPIWLADGSTTDIRRLTGNGKPTIVSLWATWCPPCQREAPAIASIRQHYGGKINLLYLNVRDPDADRDTLNKFSMRAGLPIDNYERMDDQFIERLAGSDDIAIPKTLGYDRDGKPLARITGYKPLALDRLIAMLTE